MTLNPAKEGLKPRASKTRLALLAVLGVCLMFAVLGRHELREHSLGPLLVESTPGVVLEIHLWGSWARDTTRRGFSDIRGSPYAASVRVKGVDSVTSVDLTITDPTTGALATVRSWPHRTADPDSASRVQSTYDLVLTPGAKLVSGEVRAWRGPHSITTRFTGILRYEFTTSWENVLLEAILGI